MHTAVYQVCNWTSNPETFQMSQEESLCDLNSLIFLLSAWNLSCDSSSLSPQPEEPPKSRTEKRPPSSGGKDSVTLILKR